MAGLFEPHEFSWKEVTFGLQRILLGLIKKMIVSARLAILVDTVYGNPVQYTGLYIWIAAGLFMMQLYMDFSGCMDIVTGISQCYGIILPENFDCPFLSESVQEFWQKWHITLGSWARDYILYPLLRSRQLQKVSGIMRRRIPKSTANHIVSFIAMLPVWLFVGLWHGNNPKYALGMGLWFWLCIVLENLLSVPSKRWMSVLSVRTDTFSWRLFRRIRTFLLVAVGNMFFRLESIKETFSVIRLGLKRMNPWILFDGSLYELGLDRKNMSVMLLFLIFVLLLSAAERQNNVREWIAGQGALFRSFAYIFMIWSILVFGLYGPGYEMAGFIYEQF